MGIIEIGLLLVAVAYGLALARVQLDRKAIERREQMVPAVREIIEDPEASYRLKRLAGVLMADCMKPTLAVSISWFALLRWVNPTFRHRTHPDMGSHELDRLVKLINNHAFPVNLRAGVHWHIVVLVVAVIPLLVFFARYLIHRHLKRATTKITRGLDTGAFVRAQKHLTRDDDNQAGAH